MVASKMFMVLAAALPLAAMGAVTRDCMDAFNDGIENARVSEACGWVETLETCLGELSIPSSSKDAEEISDAEGVLGANQIRYTCQRKAEIIRRGTQIGTDDGNVNIDVDESRDFHVSRIARDSVNVWTMNQNLKSAETDAKAAFAELAQIKIDIEAEQKDLAEFRKALTDHKSATTDIAKLEARVDNLKSLNDRVKDLRKSLNTVSATKDAFVSSVDMQSAKLASDAADDQSDFENDMLEKVGTATTAAAEATVAAGSIAVTAEKMPAGTVVQTTTRQNENTGGDRCSQSYCVQVPHYGNNMNNYRKSPCFIQITAVRANSHYFFKGNQYMYTIGGSHYYLDYKRTVNGGGEKSLVMDYRKSSITDQLYGGHPSQGGGYMNYPIFLDKKAKAAKGAVVKYTLWVASWSGGRFYMHGYPNNNERSLNTYNLWEIAA